MPTAPKKRPGRPPKPEGVRTGNFSVRLPVELRERLEAAAAEAGRSVNAEIATRLELSFRMGEHKVEMEKLFDLNAAQRQQIEEKLAQLRQEGEKMQRAIEAAQRWDLPKAP